MWHALAASTLYLPFSRGGSALPMPILHMRLLCLAAEGWGGGYSRTQSLRYPPPCPSPSRARHRAGRASGASRWGEGTLWRRCRQTLMPLAEILAIFMVAAVCGFLFFGYPVALTLGGVSLAVAVLGDFAGAM